MRAKAPPSDDEMRRYQGARLYLVDRAVHTLMYVGSIRVDRVSKVV